MRTGSARTSSKHSRKTLRRVGVGALVFAGILIATLIAGLALHWPHQALPAVAEPLPPSPPAAAAAPGDRSSLGADIEAQTQAYLAELEARLVEELARERAAPDRFWADLRVAAIGLSMSKPLARSSQAFMVSLGSDPRLRHALFFAMPLVGWMSEPFLFPLQTNAQADAAGALTPLLRLMDQRAAAGMSVTLDNVGDASASAAAAADYRRFYAGLFQAYGQSGRADRLHVSLKLSALVSDLPSVLGPNAHTKRAELAEALRWLLRQADLSLPNGVFIRIDMEEYAYKDLTIALFRELVESEPELTRDKDGRLRLGIVTQAYLRDAAHDMAAIAAWARARGVRVPVRLVKGAYVQYEKDLARSEGRKPPVWSFKSSTDANYEALTQFLLANLDAFEPALATHNMRSQAHVMAVARQFGLSASDYELQMLYGMGEPLKATLVGFGVQLREYVPAGPLPRGLGYAGRRFLELASRDNALSRSLHGDFTAVATRPAFQGAEDIADGDFSLGLLGGG
ncbi:MAG: hypothetical protein EOM91_17100 [Sphingobacteriia bacterium]|nr:hypothetical protein [Sphingobacteriia bacterium]NCC40807.1 hypothetical protein [Gammaproteobacteria bacterium]